MRKFSPIALITLALILSGCDQDFATLDFGSSVQANSGYGVKQIYQEELAELLLAENIKPSLIDLKPEGKSLVLATSIINGIEDAQKAALKVALENIIAYRTAPAEIKFTLRLEEVESKLASAEDVAKLKTEYSAKVKAEKVLIGVNYGIQDIMMSAFEGTNTSKSEAFCSVRLALEPALPFFGLDVVRDEQGEATDYVLLRTSKNSYGQYRIPTDIRIDQPELQSLLKSKKILMLTELTSGGINGNPFNRKGMNAIEVRLGSLGEIEHENRNVDYWVLTNLKGKCRTMAADLGRPFSFTMGDSLDRLENAVFY